MVRNTSEKNLKKEKSQNFQTIKKNFQTLRSKLSFSKGKRKRVNGEEIFEKKSKNGKAFLFGEKLEKLLVSPNSSEIDIPEILVHLFNVLYNNGRVEGIFRIAGAKSVTVQIRFATLKKKNPEFNFLEIKKKKNRVPRTDRFIWRRYTFCWGYFEIISQRNT